MNNEKLGNLYIIAAPSGAGKTTLVHSLLQTVKNIELSISYTTRPPRPGDVNGVDYFFVDESEFQNMIQANQFLEYAEVYGFHYGTAREQVLGQLRKGKDVLLEIDWQGAAQIRKNFHNAVSIFILPPSLVTLKERLYNRKQDQETVIQERLSKAQEEISHCSAFDYLIVNDQFQEALQSLIAIVKVQRLRMNYQTHELARLLDELQ